MTIFYTFLQALERKSSFMSDATMESISGSETSTAPSSLQTIVRAPVVTSTNHHGSNMVLPQLKNTTTNNNNAETSNSETESVYNHANNLRKVSEKMLLGNVVPQQQQQHQQQNSRNRSSLTGIPRLNNKALINNIAGSEMRPSSYAGPHHTIGLPVMSPTSRLNQTLPTSSANSTLERPASATIRKISDQNGQLKKSDISAKIVSSYFYLCYKI